MTVPDGLRDAVALFSALAHPVRLEVLLRLHRGGPVSVGALQRAMGVEQSALSHQLRLLRDARLVDAQRDGRRVLYRIHDAHVAHIIEDAITHVQEQP